MELKPCPLCDSDVKKTYQGNEHTKKRAIIISCTTFGCTIKYSMGTIQFGFDWLEKAITKKWNTRTDCANCNEKYKEGLADGRKEQT